MCGWVCFWESINTDQGRLSACVRQMADTLAHRGPDDAQAWVDPESGVAIGFRRLAIVDLSPEGAQPMHSESGRYVIAFNGEVYNFGALRQQLEPMGHHFRGHSDTEVMLAAIEQWGLEAAVRRFVGMFAFALWDREKRQLSLVRDRLGIKPLYYGRMGQTFLCGSELKALYAHPDFRHEINRDALTLFVRHNYVPTPYTIYKGIHKLLPGCILTIVSPDSDWSSLASYWSPKIIAEQGAANPFTGSAREAAEQLDDLLREAVSLRMIADVPLGAFLSGGVDSSLVVALMQAQSQRPVKTFSIGFNEAGYNEAIYARKVAEHLGTDHTELYVMPAQAQAVIPKLPEIYDEPFSDSSQIPTFLVSELARRHVTVSLSGDGGDELFGGYDHYFLGQAIWCRISHIPMGVRLFGAKMITRVSPTDWGREFNWLRLLLPHGLRRGIQSDKLHKLANLLVAENPEEMYGRLVSQWKSPASVVIGGCEPATVFTDRSRWAVLPDFTQRMMYLDLISLLPDDFLTKVDRASMAISLEARVPLLDHRLVEFAARIPLAMKIRNGQGKWLLRQLLYKYVPAELIERPKMGFGVPIAAWLRGPLREWAETLLDERRLREEGFFNPAPVRHKWMEHLSQSRNWQYQLWNILQFQAWLERWGHASEASN